MVKNRPANAGDNEFDPCVRKIPWRRKWQPAPVVLREKPHGQRSLVVNSTAELPEGREPQVHLTRHQHVLPPLCGPGVVPSLGASCVTGR